MSEYPKGPLLVEGKTKRLHMVVDHSDLVIVESKKDITANDDPRFTREFETKAIAANVTTCNVFQLLRDNGIPVAFKKRISDTEFLADDCIMIPLEIIGRRYAVGSFLKREPTFKRADGKEPYKFDNVCVEFFLKTTAEKCVFNGKNLISGLTVEDPYISNPYDSVWKLREPKLPYSNGKSVLRTFYPKDFLVGPVSIEILTSLLKSVFICLESAFAKQNIRKIDIKIEVGINCYGKLVVSDVIDNDSWRIVTLDWEDLSKQSFRDGEDLSEVEKKYLRVMEITNKFVTPNVIL